jgi:pilus assembly protein CpaE
MAQLTVLISTTDSDFKAQVSRLLRASGVSVVLVDDRHSTAHAPSLAVVDIRTGSARGVDAIERFRSSWPSATIFAIASAAEPDQILQAMRAGANEYLAWSVDQGGPLDSAFPAAVHRAVERAKPKDGSRSSSVLSFFGVKGGVGTTTIAVNSAIEIARMSKRPTLIIDMHQFLGEVALFLGVRPRFTLVDALDNLHRLDSEFLRELVVKHKTGLDILAGGEQSDRPSAHDGPSFEQLLQILGRTYDFIVIDAGLLTSPCTDIAVYAADTVYVVANPDIASVRNAHRVVDRMVQLGAGRDRLKLLLNRLSDDHEIGPKHIESTLGHSVHTIFPSDYNVVASAPNSGVPLTLSNHSALAAQFTALTKQIVSPGMDEPAAEPPRARAPFLGIF